MRRIIIIPPLTVHWLGRCLFLRRIVAQNGNKNASVIDKQRE